MISIPKTRFLVSTTLLLWVVLLAAPPAWAQPNWEERSLFNRPGPSAPARDQSAAPPTPARAGQPGELKVPPVSPAVPAAPLTPELQDEFLNAETMSVSEYLQRYGQQSPDATYRVGPMDVLSVKVFDEDDLARENLRVSADGGITLPLVGRVKVQGMTTAAIEKQIEKQYKDGGFLRQPHVSVNIQEFKSRQVLVMGAVNEPGTHPMEGSERLLEMLAKAGGIKFDPQGDIAANSIRILRTHKAKDGATQRISMAIDLESLTRGLRPQYNLIMQDRDVIYVPEAPRFYVTGEVKNPGSYKIKDRPISVAEAITLAGGPTPTASLNRTRVVRSQSGEEVTLYIPVSDILDGDKNKDVQVLPNDHIFVPQSLF